MPTQIAIIGASFAGLNAALELRRIRPDAEDTRITVFSESPDFVFLPSLIWIPFGNREPDEISFSLAPLLASKDIGFEVGTVTAIDPHARTIRTNGDASFSYDFLILASGSTPDFSAFPNFAAQTIVNLPTALETRAAFERLVSNPGPAVVGLAPNASLFGVGYEFALNLAHELRERGLGMDRVPITFLTPEPHLGHFGMGCAPETDRLLQRYFDEAGIRVRTNAAITGLEAGKLRLAFQETIEFSFAMILPAYNGSPLLRASGLTDESGLVPVDQKGQHTAFLNVYAAGSCVAVRTPWKTPIAVGVNKTALPAEEMAFIAAHNIAAEIEGREPESYPQYADLPAFLLLDIGSSGVLIATDNALPPHGAEFVLPSSAARWAKVAYEKYYLWKMRHGFIALP